MEREERLIELYDELNKKYCEQQDELINAKQENTQLKQQLAIIEKALELACGYINCLDVDGFECKCEKNCIDCHNKCHSEKHLSNYFKTKAKGMLENE